ncbi:sugar phosphate isomerase/epimerase [Paenibacillus rhizosphaerae]|uniref:Sugar phosphate isomerase/epimerase n=1 Tax=Paenibacillus rhizosphaerae TaxID=297318 RepID=A0A839TST3_9BACL|nr:sugar phosphate isomerase/epimerase family protein [Paenibacillus rhizosphaerae]MBB3128438.1 sugar phosphate isomerase/epimerase [Paenibacillus rhizosphaerae]
MNCLQRSAPPVVTWGYALVWYGGFLKPEGNPVLERLDFLRRHGLTSTGISLADFTRMDGAARSRVGELTAQHGLQLTPHIGFDFLHADADTREKEIARIGEELRRSLPLLRGSIVTTAMHAGHRFDRVMPVEAKLERVRESLAPLARICEELGAPLCVENHGDFYVSDLVDLCRATDSLYLYLDTGNTYLIGERPLPAFELAAPYVIGTHFKDHLVRPCPNARPLHFEVAGSALGEGDVPLRECYELLMKHAPLDRLVMEIEMVSPDDMDPAECLERSLRFVRSLGAGQPATA